MTEHTELWLVRHGETEWSRSAKHTGRSDVPLTGTGRANARWLGLGPEGGRLFALAPASLSVLGREHETRVIQSWNRDPELDHCVVR